MAALQVTRLKIQLDYGHVQLHRLFFACAGAAEVSE